MLIKSSGGGRNEMGQDRDRVWILLPGPGPAGAGQHYKEHSPGDRKTQCIHLQLLFSWVRSYAVLKIYNK